MRLRHTTPPLLDELDLTIVSLTVTGLGLFTQATGRYAILHVLPTTIPAALVAVALLTHIPALRHKAGTSICLVAVLAGALTHPYILDFTERATSIWDNWQPWGCYSDPMGTESDDSTSAHLSRASCVPLHPGQAWVVGYLQSKTAPDDYVFVGNTHHDKIVVNDLATYFLANRRCPTVYCELHPGVATTQPVQEHIIADIEAKKVDWLVTVVVWEPSEPNASALSSGVTVLDDYIEATFVPVAERSGYTIWQRAANG